MADKKTKEVRNKATNAEAILRVSQIESLLIGGASFSEIVLFCSDEYGIGERQTANYIKKARQNIEETTEISRQYELTRGMRRLDNLYKRSLKVQDFKTALAIQKEIHALHGLYQPKKIEATITQSWHDLMAIDETDMDSDEFA